MKRTAWLAAWSAAALGCWGAAPATADVVTLTPSKDNTIYGGTERASGVGPGVLLGATAASGEVRRGLMAFDLGASVPAGAVVNSVSLTFTLTKSGPLPGQLSLHRALTNWGEGASNAFDRGGVGAPAQPNDATWTHAVVPVSLWTTVGGDFSAAASATTPVGFVDLQPIEFAVASTPQLVADVQGWVNSAASNFGWFLIGAESSAGSARELASRETATPTRLTIDFTGGTQQPKWARDGGGSWRDPESWSDGMVPDAPGAVARFVGPLSPQNTPAIVALDDNRTVGTLVFDDSTTGGINPRTYIIDPGLIPTATLTLDGGGSPARLQSLSGDHGITAAVSVADSAEVQVAAGAMLTLSAGLAAQPGVQISRTGAGSLHINGGVTLGAGAALEVNEGAVRVDRITGGIVRVGGTGDLTIDPFDPSSPASKVDVLEIAGMPGGFAGKVDLTDSAIIIQPASPELAAFALEEATAQAGGGRVDGSQGLWTGRGITSSVAAADAESVHGIAVVLNDGSAFGGGGPVLATFRGEAVDSNSVIVAYTLNGDVDLDGRITARDYFAIDVGRALGRIGYAFGDFDYSGEVADAADYMLIDRAFLWQHEAPSLVAAVVPEPSFLASLVGTAVIARRRRL